MFFALGQAVRYARNPASGLAITRNAHAGPYLGPAQLITATLVGSSELDGAGALWQVTIQAADPHCCSGVPVSGL